MRARGFFCPQKRRILYRAAKAQVQPAAETPDGEHRMIRRRRQNINFFEALFFLCAFLVPVLVGIWVAEQSGGAMWGWLAAGAVLLVFAGPVAYLAVRALLKGGRNGAGGKDEGRREDFTCDTEDGRR